MLLKVKLSPKQPNQSKKKAPKLFFLIFSFLFIMFLGRASFCLPTGVAFVKAKATIRLPMKSEKQLAALIMALTPEVQKQIGTRSKVTLSKETQILALGVEAEDIVALRAALNAYLRWINSTMNVLDAVAK